MRIAAALQAGSAAGERALLLYPPGLEYIAGFFGCLYAGVIAVPAYPPDPMRLERTLPRLRAIIRDAQARVVLTTSFILGMAEALFEQAPELARAALGGHRRAGRPASERLAPARAGARTRWPSSSTPRAPPARPRA